MYLVDERGNEVHGVPVPLGRNSETPTSKADGGLPFREPGRATRRQPGALAHAQSEMGTNHDGDANPDDQSIVLALTTPCQHAALFRSASGPTAASDDLYGSACTHAAAERSVV